MYPLLGYLRCWLKHLFLFQYSTLLENLNWLILSVLFSHYYYASLLFIDLFITFNFCVALPQRLGSGLHTSLTFRLLSHLCVMCEYVVSAFRPRCMQKDVYVQILKLYKQYHDSFLLYSIVGPHASTEFFVWCHSKEILLMPCFSGTLVQKVTFFVYYSPPPKKKYPVTFASVIRYALLKQVLLLWLVAICVSWIGFLSLE